MIQFLVGIIFVVLLFILVAACKTSDTNDEEDIKRWLAEHDKNKRNKNGPDKNL